MRVSVPSTRYSSVCNVLCLWRISLIPTYRVYRLYDTSATLAIAFAEQDWEPTARRYALSQATHSFTGLDSGIVQLEGPCAFIWTQDESGRFPHPRTDKKFLHSSPIVRLSPHLPSVSICPTECVRAPVCSSVCVFVCLCVRLFVCAPVCVPACSSMHAFEGQAMRLRVLLSV